MESNTLTLGKYKCEAQGYIAVVTAVGEKKVSYFIEGDLAMKKGNGKNMVRSERADTLHIASLIESGFWKNL